MKRCPINLFQNHPRTPVDCIAVNYLCFLLYGMKTNVEPLPCLHHLH